MAAAFGPVNMSAPLLRGSAAVYWYLLTGLVEIPDPPVRSARLATNLGTEEMTSPGTSMLGRLRK